KIHGLGYGICEIPFHYRAREKGASKARLLKFGWQLLRTLLRLWRLRNRGSCADYDDRAFDSRIFLQRWWQRTRRRLVTRLLGTPGRTLDVGCGSSRIIRGIPGGIGLDVALPKLRHIRNRGATGVAGTVHALPFPDGSFDGVIFSEVIEHLPRDPRILGEIRRVLRPGGTLVIGTPDYGRIFWTVLEAFYRALSPGAYGHEHITHHTLRSLRALLGGHGFAPERARYVGGGELIVRARRATESTSRR
ncbi:MAG: class I SAM-dependent methyltransferase, partial [Planctomycetota bacterium]